MKNIIDQSIKKGAEYAEVYQLDQKNDKVSFNNSKLESISSRDISGFSLLLKKDNRVGSVSSSNYSKIDEILEDALLSTAVGDQIDYDFNKPVNIAVQDFNCPSLWDIPYEKFIDDGQKAIQLVNEYDSRVKLQITFQRASESKYYWNSYGCDYESCNDILLIDLVAILIQKQSMLETGLTYHNKTSQYSIEEIINRLINEVKIGREETDLTGGKMPVLLTPKALSQIAYALVAGISGESVRQGISPLKGRIGEQIFDERITLIDDLTLADGSESARFDDQGTPAERTVIYQNGVLENYLLDLKSANQLNLRPNGKAFRKQFLQSSDPSVTPNPWFSNWLIEKGDTEYDDMIADIKEGLIIDDITGLIMGNLLQGDIDSDIVLGYKVKDGKVVGRVKDAAIGTNLYDIFKNKVVAVENKQHFAASLTGHMLLPHILLKDINIIK